jgi:NTE family protein
MLYHLGTLLRLAELGVLANVARITSVSGGSITAARLALSWNDIFTGDQVEVGARFSKYVVTPIRALARKTIDAPAIISGVLLPGPISRRIERAYHSVLGECTTLQDLPENPRFVICASNLQSGALPTPEVLTMAYRNLSRGRR